MFHYCREPLSLHLFLMIPPSELYHKHTSLHKFHIHIMYDIIIARIKIQYKNDKTTAQTFLWRVRVSMPWWQSIINTGSSLLLDQSSPGFQSCVHSVCAVWLCFRDFGYWRWPVDVLQLSAAGMEVGFELSAAVSEEVTSLLVSTESSSMDSVASFTALLSSETQEQSYCWRSVFFNTESIKGSGQPSPCSLMFVLMSIIDKIFHNNFDKVALNTFTINNRA